MATEAKRNSRDFFILHNFLVKNMYEHQYKAGFRRSGYDHRRPKWCSGWYAECSVPDNSWSFSAGLALDWPSSLVKHKPCLE
jgi:arginyl-tRNA--protein-N-Asp/Glu arginylyltransferase